MEIEIQLGAKTCSTTATFSLLNILISNKEKTAKFIPL